MNIIWLSSSKFGYELLKEAVKITDIKCIVTLSDKATTVSYDNVDLKDWYDFDLPVYEIEDINKETKLFKNIKPNIVVVAGWRQIIKPPLIDNCMFIGFHPTLLPKGRGNCPIIHTILDGLTESGVSMFYISDGVDNGDIIGQERFFIEKNDYAEDIYNKVIEGGRKLIRKYLQNIINGTNCRYEQNEKEATYNKKLELSNNEINLNDSLEDIYKKIRALSKPYRGAYIKKDGKKLIIWKAELIDD